MFLLSKKLFLNNMIPFFQVYITPEQIGIGVMTNLVVIPPSILLINLFRKSRPKTTKLQKFKRTMIKNNLKDKLLT